MENKEKDEEVEEVEEVFGYEYKDCQCPCCFKIFNSDDELLSHICKYDKNLT